MEGEGATERLDGSKADRRHRRERIPVPAQIFRAEGLRMTGGLVDISVGGVRISTDQPLDEGEAVQVRIEKFRFVAKGRVLRVYPTSIGYDVAIRFDQEHPEITSRLLEYKARSLRR